MHTAATVALHPGDELLIVTDGITEAANPAKELFGEPRVVQLLLERDVHAAALLGELHAEVEQFEAGFPQSDDIAAILLQRLKGPPAA